MHSEEISGHLVLLMAPSGSGKGEMIEGLGDLKDEMYFLKTFTSRERRKGAHENPKYNFVTREVFEDMLARDAFVEWANYSGNYYGTSKEELMDALAAGKVAFKEMELQGIAQIRKLLPADKVTVVYIDAGDWSSLEKRITARASISEEELRLRKERYEAERDAMHIADVVIKNHDGMLEEARVEFRKTISHILEGIKA